MKTQLIKDLEFALSLKRPHGGTGVTMLCNYIVERVGEGDLSVDFCGNIHETCVMTLLMKHYSLLT
jgi:hypothetical protein